MSRERAVSRSRWNRLRGRLVVALRHTVTHPVARRLPVDTLRRGHDLRRRLVANRYTDADPFKLLTVDPHRIERSILESAPTHPQWGRVQGGSWDRTWEPFDERAVPRAIVDRYDDGRPWRETPLYEAYCEQLTRFGNAWEWTTLEAFDDRCEEVEQLYESIRTHGYCRQEQLHDEGSRPTVATRTDEINVDIGRDGTLYWRGYGQHRLAIAQYLDLEAVPVFVHRRHRRWQAIRDEVRTGTDSLEAAVKSTHPDLQDL